MTITRSPRLGLLFVLALAVRAAVAAGAWTHPERFLTEEDSGEYAILAFNLSAGNGFSQAAFAPYDPDVRRTPVYPSVLAAMMVLLPGSESRVAALTGMLISALTVLAAFRLGQSVAGDAAGWWAAALLAIDLTTAAYAGQILTEPLFTLLLVLSFLPLTGHAGGATIAAVSAGALSGLAALCRPIAILAFAALAPACRLRSTTAGGAVRLWVIAAMMAG